LKTIQQKAVSVNQLLVDRQQSPTCLSSLIDDYIFFDRLSQQGCSSAVTTDPRISTFIGPEFYRNCKENIFGEDLVGIDCLEDNDCSSIQSHSICDQNSYLCLFNLSQSTASFFDCLIEFGPPEFKNSIHSMGSTGQSLFDILMTKFTTTECVSPYSLSIDTKHYQSSPYINSCPSCHQWRCLEQSCKLPWVCEGVDPYGRPGERVIQF